MADVVCTTCGKKFKRSVQRPLRCPHCCTIFGEAESTLAPSVEAWYYRVLGQEIGPVAFLDLQQAVRDGKVSPETQVRRAANGRWLLAEQVTGLCNRNDDRAEWFFTHDGKKLGPVSYPMLRKLIVAGQLASADLLWQKDWPKAVTVGKCLADNLLLLPADEIPVLSGTDEIAFACPSCGDRYPVNQELAGKRVLCRSCDQPSVVG